MSYSVKLLGKEDVAEGTVSFRFEKPKDFVFKAGQNVDMEIINPPETDKEGNKRTFSIVSSPSRPFLEFATRIRDTAFKRVLKNMPLGSEVEIDGPYGNFVLQADSVKPAVFLSGGIGITPFMSIIRDAAERKLPHKIFLFYSNRRPEDTAFLGDLQKTEKENPNFKLIVTMTADELEFVPNKMKRPESWFGEKGRIDSAMISKYVGDVKTPIYYIAGPPQMVAGLWKVLEEMGVSPDNLKTEEFAGY